MRQPRRSILVLFLATILWTLNTGAQAQSSVVGVLRDPGGSALPAVALTLTQSSPPAVTLHATTDKLGAFHFDRLAAGTYLISTDRGDRITPNSPIVLSPGAATLRLDLTLATSVEPERPVLQLQAAGIRGYIDPGGYSAPAGAAAATRIIQGAADLNRVGNVPEDAALRCEHEPVLLKASRDHPDSAAAQSRLGLYYLSTHQPEKALPPLRQAWSLDKRDSKTLASLAEALLQNRQFATAHDLLTQDAPGADKAGVHRLLARSDEGLGAFQQASTEYRAASALAPTEADFYGAGYELILAGSARTAIDAFESGIKRYPDSTTLLTGLGTAKFLLGQSTEATRIFLRCTTLHPDDQRLYPFLSASFALSGADPDAVGGSFRRFYELSPNNAEAAYFYALFLLHRSPTGTPLSSLDAATLLERAIHLRPGLAKAHLQLGSVYFDRGDFNHAIEEFTTVLRLDPEQWETHYRLSTAYRRAAQTAQADRQMQLFQAHKSQTAKENQLADVQIEEFLSVFTRPNTTPSPNTTCPAEK